MKTLNRYIGFDIPEAAEDHVRTMIWLATDVTVNNNTSLDVLCEINHNLRFKPYKDQESNITFNNLSDLCRYYSEQFTNDIASGNIADDNTEVLPKDPDELSAYMASNFGIAR